MSDSVQPHRRQRTRLRCPWDSPSKNTGWVAISISNAWKWKVKVKSLSRARLSDPMDCNLPGSSIHGIFQARVLEWGAIVEPWIKKSPLLHSVKCFRVLTQKKQLPWGMHKARGLGKYRDMERASASKFRSGNSLVVQWLRLYALNELSWAQLELKAEITREGRFGMLQKRHGERGRVNWIFQYQSPNIGNRNSHWENSLRNHLISLDTDTEIFLLLF